MKFEPINLEAGLRITSETLDGRPTRCTIALSGAPSKEWSQEFEGFQWEQAGVSASQFPKITSEGLEIPALPKAQLVKLLNCIQMAADEINKHEVERHELMGPGPDEVYAEWLSQRRES
jgi:hypothetical protein